MEMEPSRDLVVPEGAFRAKRLKLHFVPVIDSQADADPHWITLIAFVHVTPVGYLTWRNDDGEADLIWVEEVLRLRGIATALWEQARQLAKERRWVQPRQSSDRSAEGDAWARTVEQADDLPSASICPPWNTISPEYYVAREQRWQGYGWASN